MHTTAYAVEAFVAAARRVGGDVGIDLEVVLASDRCPILDRAWDWPPDSWVIDFYDPDGAADAIAARAAADPDAPVRAVLPVGGEGPARVAALAARRIGLAGRDPDAVAAFLPGDPRSFVAYWHDYITPTGSTRRKAR